MSSQLDNLNGHARLWQLSMRSCPPPQRGLGKCYRASHEEPNDELGSNPPRGSRPSSGQVMCIYQTLEGIVACLLVCMLFRIRATSCIFVQLFVQDDVGQRSLRPATGTV